MNEAIMVAGQLKLLQIQEMSECVQLQFNVS